MRLCETDSQGCMMRMACGDCECPEEEPQEECEVPCRFVDCSGVVSSAHGKCTMCNWNYLDEGFELSPPRGTK